EAPQRRAGPRVDREQISFAARRKDDSARGREQPGCQRPLRQRKLPHGLAVLRIDRLDAGRTGLAALGAAAAGILTPERERLRVAGVPLAAFRVFEIDPSGDGTVRRRLKVGPTAN